MSPPLCAGFWVRLCGSTPGAVNSCSPFKHTPLYFISNRHRLKVAKEQPPSNERAPTFTSSQNQEADGPQVPPIHSLRCTICYGCRSASYHRKHSSDPIRFPAAGVCSRRQTKCKLFQARWSGSAMDLLAIPELPADSHMIEKRNSPKKPLASL